MSTITEPPHAEPARRHDLAEARLEDLLLHGLTMDESDPAIGIVDGVRSELHVLAELIQRGLPDDLDVAEFGTVLEGLERRLAVGVELLHRARTHRARNRADA